MINRESTASSPLIYRAGRIPFVMESVLVTGVGVAKRSRSEHNWTSWEAAHIFLLETGLSTIMGDGLRTWMT